MPNTRLSLVAGRNRQPLTERQQRDVSNLFLGFERELNAHYDPESPTLFSVKIDEAGQSYGDVSYGPDIYPGNGLADPNSSLSVKCAVAHEVSHFNRWKDGTEINAEALGHLDEALTSLDAIKRFPEQLRPVEIQSLVSDAIQRIMLYIEEIS